MQFNIDPLASNIHDCEFLKKKIKKIINTTDYSIGFVLSAWKTVANFYRMVTMFITSRVYLGSIETSTNTRSCKINEEHLQLVEEIQKNMIQHEVCCTTL